MGLPGHMAGSKVLLRLGFWVHAYGWLVGVVVAVFVARGWLAGGGGVGSGLCRPINEPAELGDRDEGASSDLHDA